MPEKEVVEREAVKVEKAVAKAAEKAVEVERAAHTITITVEKKC